jgi:hypothetical protein
LMRTAFETALANAALFSRCRPNIMAVDSVVFRRPVEIGSILLLSSQVSYSTDCFMQVSFLGFWVSVWVWIGFYAFLATQNNKNLHSGLPNPLSALSSHYLNLNKYILTTHKSKLPIFRWTWTQRSWTLKAANPR